MRVASFFSGIGGIDLGFERAGMEIVYQCEILTFGQKILRKHWPTVPLGSDITKITGADVPEAEVFVGGFPCQDLSLANQGKRKGLEGARSGLFFKYAELIDEKRPRWVFIENVPGLINSAKGGDFKVVLETLDEFGYCVAWRVLDAQNFGTPQRRRRTYIVASLGTIGAAEVLFEPGSDTILDTTGDRQRNFTAAAGGDFHRLNNGIFDIGSLSKIFSYRNAHNRPHLFCKIYHTYDSKIGGGASISPGYVQIASFFRYFEHKKVVFVVRRPTFLTGKGGCFHSVYKRRTCCFQSVYKWRTGCFQSEPPDIDIDIVLD